MTSFSLPSEQSRNRRQSPLSCTTSRPLFTAFRRSAGCFLKLVLRWTLNMFGGGENKKTRRPRGSFNKGSGWWGWFSRTVCSSRHSEEVKDGLWSSLAVQRHRILYNMRRLNTERRFQQYVVFLFMCVVPTVQTETLQIVEGCTKEYSILRN